MKKFFMALCLFSASVGVSAESYVTVCYWTVSAITEAKDTEGNVAYSVYYRGKSYPLSLEQYCELMDGKDINLKVD